MKTDPDIDLSFLDDDIMMGQFVDSLFSFHVLVFKNDDVDMRVIEVDQPIQIGGVMKGVFNDVDTTTQVVMKNGREDERVPFFRVVMENYSVKTPVNYKLETFLRKSGILGIHARCTTAMVIGMHGNHLDAVLVDIPRDYHNIPIMNFDLIDLTASRDDIRKKANDYLMDLPGVPLPYQLPRDVHFHIMQYLRSPSADIFLDHMRVVEEHVAYWNRHFADILFSPGPW